MGLSLATEPDDGLLTVVYVSAMALRRRGPLDASRRPTKTSGRDREAARRGSEAWEAWRVRQQRAVEPSAWTAAHSGVQGTADGARRTRRKRGRPIAQSTDSSLECGAYIIQRCDLQGEVQQEDEGSEAQRRRVNLLEVRGEMGDLALVDQAVGVAQTS